MATDVVSSTTGFGFGLSVVIAGLGAALAYTQFGSQDTRAHDADKEQEQEKETEGLAAVRGEKEARRGGDGRQGRKNKGRGDGDTHGREKGKGKEGGEGTVRAGTPVVPGDFAVAADIAPGADAKVGVGLRDATGTTPKPGNGGKTKRRKKKQPQRQSKGKRREEEEEEGSETGKEDEEGGDEAKTVHTATHGVPRSGDSTDADTLPSSSPPAPSHAVGKANLRASTSTRFALPSQPHGQVRPQVRPHAPSLSRAVRPSLSFDTDSSWTHVDHRRSRMTSGDGQDGQTVDAIDVTSSDLASTESNSPVAERTEGAAGDIRGTRADLARRTLAEKLAPRPEATSIDDMLEQSDVTTLARVMRVQPRANETPALGFSWEDYGEVVEESVLVHDADQEDEGEWGIVKSRNRTRPAQSVTATTSTVSMAPETMTKKQRQNARKRELAKAVKAETEAVRLEGLAKHKRELERLRIIEQSQQGGGKRPSGGMHAMVDERGKLVWE